MKQTEKVPVATTTIDTRLGRVMGIDYQDAMAFLGIRYGKPPTGSQRFLPPEASGASPGTYDATFLHNQAVQVVHYTFYHETQREEMGALDEDCLFLNVFTPAADGRRRPVMVWIHGGGYVEGSANEYNGIRLATQGDIVVVAINYRVGAFGFFDLSALGSDYEGSANNGIRDMILALEWVRDNISDYGGDPDCVTVFGESSGGEAVLLLLGAPEAEGKFHRAIAHSPGGGLADPKKRNLQNLCRHLGKEEALSPDGFLDYLLEMKADDLQKVARTGPSVDGVVVTRTAIQVYHEKGSNGIPIILGTNRDEGTFMSYGAGPGRWTDETDRKGFELVMTDVMRRNVLGPAEAAGAAGRPVWLYRLDLPSTFLGGSLGATHAADIPLTFNYPAIGTKCHIFYVPISPEARELGQAWSSTCMQFARTGNPNGAGYLPDWPVYDTRTRRTMVLNAPCRVVDDLDARDERDRNPAIHAAFIRHKEAMGNPGKKG